MTIEKTRNGPARTIRVTIRRGRGLTIGPAEFLTIQIKGSEGRTWYTFD